MMALIKLSFISAVCTAIKMFLWGQINVEVVLSHLFRLQYYRSHYQGGMATDKVIVNTEWSPKFVKLFENMSHRYFSTEHPFVDVLRCLLSYLKTLTISIKMHTVSVLFDPVMLKKWTVVFVCSFSNKTKSTVTRIHTFCCNLILMIRSDIH